ncbi:MAG: heavy metal-associated domain-containing protein [Paludibacteraceae bacterium]
MYSEFEIIKTNRMTCTNQTLKKLGTLQGVFGAEINRINGNVLVSHTDEVRREEIKEMLETLGYIEDANKNK